jgi:hypothetical protein
MKKTNKIIISIALLISMFTIDCAVIDSNSEITTNRMLEEFRYFQQTEGESYPFDVNMISDSTYHPSFQITLSKQQQDLQNGFFNLDFMEVTQAIKDGANINISYARFSRIYGFGFYQDYLAAGEENCIGITPLMDLCLQSKLAKESLYQSFFRQLIQLPEINLKKQNKFLQTAMHYAAMALNEFALLTLAEKDPSLITMKDDQGNTVLDLLNQRKNNKEAANLIVKLNQILQKSNITEQQN